MKKLMATVAAVATLAMAANAYETVTTNGVTCVSLYGGRVHMGYGSCSHGTGYVNLGTNMLDTTAATIEIWARHDGVEKKIVPVPRCTVLDSSCQ